MLHVYPNSPADVAGCKVSHLITINVNLHPYLTKAVNLDN